MHQTNSAWVHAVHVVCFAQQPANPLHNNAQRGVSTLCCVSASPLLPPSPEQTIAHLPEWDGPQHQCCRHKRGRRRGGGAAAAKGAAAAGCISVSHCHCHCLLRAQPSRQAASSLLYDSYVTDADCLLGPWGY